MSNHLETVESIYQAFGRGDVAAILEQLSPDVQWDPWTHHSAQQAGYDLLQARTGRAAVADFFSLLAAQTFHEFKVLDIVAGERQAAAELQVDFTYGTTGRRVRDEEVHLWSFGADGKVTRFRHYIDTAKHMEAAGLLAAA